MSSLDWVKSKINLKIDDWCGDADLYVTTNSTADGYDLHIVANDLKRLDWENEVFYYNDDEYINAIVDAIDDMHDWDHITIYDGTMELEDNEYLWDEVKNRLETYAEYED